jgi:hypothetical protein
MSSDSSDLEEYPELCSPHLTSHNLLLAQWDTESEPEERKRGRLAAAAAEARMSASTSNKDPVILGQPTMAGLDGMVSCNLDIA